MSATNTTTHYQFPSFIGTDKPSWLVDWNGAMAAIDAAIYQAQTDATAAMTKATTNEGNITSLSGTVTELSTSLSTVSGSLTTLIGTVNTITSLIGNGEPTTTDKTLIGAINELNSDKAPAAREFVQVVSDGVKTWKELLEELYAEIDTDKIKSDSFFEISETSGQRAVYVMASWNVNTIVVQQTRFASGSAVVTTNNIHASSASRHRVTCKSSDNTITSEDLSNTVKPEVGDYLKFIY